MRPSHLACLLFIGIAVLVAAATRQEPRHHAWWEAPPVIRVCKTSPASVGQVNLAVRQWAEIGWGLLNVQQGCPNPPELGGITIDITDQPVSNDPHGGVETQLWLRDGVIKAATIRVPAVIMSSEPADPIVVLRHELGHALGFEDVEAKGYWMTKAIVDRGAGLQRSGDGARLRLKHRKIRPLGSVAFLCESPGRATRSPLPEDSMSHRSLRLGKPGSQ